MPKYLIINSDDFGISEGVSRGILEAYHKGIVTSTTAMVNMPAAEAAIKEAQQSAPELGLGLHLTLSFGKPVSQPETVPSLVTEAGTFVSTYDDLITKMPSFTAEDLECELTAQLERFREIAGKLPDHLDSHHGSTYYHPAAFDVMVRLAKEHDLPIRWAENLHGLDDELLQALTLILERHGKPSCCEQFVDFIFDFESVSRVERLKSGLKTIQGGYTELMVHVGYADDLEESYTFQREQELEAIIHPDIKRIIEQEGIHLINFSDLP